MDASNAGPTAVLIVEEQVVFTLTALCRASGAEAREVQALVLEGVLSPSGAQPEAWRFDGPALARTRTALRLARDLELGMPGLALVMDLLSQIERLRAQLSGRHGR